MATYTYPQQMVADAITFQRAANAQVVVYDVDDTANATPLVLTDLTGTPITNPLTSTADAIIQAFTTTAAEVKLVSGDMQIPVGSFKGMLEEAIAAKDAALDAAGVAAAAAQADLAARIAAGEFNGTPGRDGANVLPTQQAIEQALITDGPAKTALAKKVAGTTPPPVLLGATTENTETDPRFIEFFDGYMWGALNGDIYRSADEGATWSLYCNSWPGVGEESFIARIVKTADGEVLAMSNHELRKSSGWAHGNAATWSAKKVPNNGSGIFNGFSLDGDGTKFVLVEYSPIPETWSDSRYGYISLDAGNTFVQRYDSLTLHGPGADAASHLHSACYDPWNDTFYIGEGHGPAGGVYHSTDNGLTWAAAPGMRLAEPGGNYNAPTVITATDDGLVMGSDNTHNGLFGVVRMDDPMDQVATKTWTMVTGRDGLVTFAQRGWRDPVNGLVYMTFRAEYEDTRPTIAAGTAASGGLVYEWPTLPSVGGSDRFYIAARTTTSTLTAYGEISGVPTTTRGHLAYTNPDKGHISGGVASYSSSVAVGPGAKASAGTSLAMGHGATVDDGAADSVAMGDGSRATSSAATATGKNSSAGNAGTANGRGALAGMESVAIGFGAKADYNPYAVAMGCESKANLHSTAVGHGADASGHVQSVALGSGTVTTAANQVAIGDRDLEFLAGRGPIMVSPNGTRYRLTVENDGSLTTTAL